jgi:hypothetical protein
MKPNDLFTKAGEHTLIVGMNGSGKSVMLMTQCRHAELSPVIIYNTKNDRDFMLLPSGDETVIEITSFKEFTEYFKKPRDEWHTYIVVTPPRDEMIDYERLDDYLKFQYDNVKFSYAAIDEVYSFHKNGKCGAGLNEILTRGRSSKVSAIMCSQRPKWLSLFCFTESKRIFVYFIQGVKDRLEMSSCTFLPRDLILKPYYFWAYKSGEHNGTLFAPLPLPDFISKPVSEKPTIEQIPHKNVWL